MDLGQYSCVVEKQLFWEGPKDAFKDEMASACYNCSTPFPSYASNVFIRGRHHCRACRRSICKDCTQSSSKVRLCLHCKEEDIKPQSTVQFGVFKAMSERRFIVAVRLCSRGCEGLSILPRCWLNVRCCLFILSPSPCGDLAVPTPYSRAGCRCEELPRSMIG